MRWQMFQNRGDPLDRMWARRLGLGGYECQTLDGDEIGIMPRNLVTETYKLAATYIGDDFGESGSQQDSGTGSGTHEGHE